MNELITLIAILGLVATVAIGLIAVHYAEYPPRWWTRQKQRRRRKARARLLADALDRMAIATAELTAMVANNATAMASAAAAMRTFEEGPRTESGEPTHE